MKTSEGGIRKGPVLGSRLQVCRVVTLASGSGAYGGPYDTARRQMDLLRQLAAVDTVVLAGYLDGDEPGTDDTSAAGELKIRPVRPLLPRTRFSSLISVSLAKLIWQQVGRSDVVHVSVARDLIPTLAAIIALVRGRRLVAQPHGMLTSKQSLPSRVVDTLVTRPIMKRASSVIALTEVEQRQLIEGKYCLQQDVNVLGNPLPPEVRDISPETRRRSALLEAIFVSRLHPRKRVTDFIEVARIMQQAGDPIEFTIVGPDDGDLELVRSASEEIANLKYIGAVPAAEITRLVAGASVFVMPSLSEPWGNVLLTAMAVGTPVIMTESAALSPLVKAHDAGKVAPDRSPAAIAECIRILTSNVDDYNKASRNARNLVRFLVSDEAQVRNLMRAYGSESGG